MGGGPPGPTLCLARFLNAHVVIRAGGLRVRRAGIPTGAGRQGYTSNESKENNFFHLNMPLGDYHTLKGNTLIITFSSTRNALLPDNEKRV